MGVIHWLEREMIELALASKIFGDWQANLDKRFKVKSVFFMLDLKVSSAVCRGVGLCAVISVWASDFSVAGAGTDGENRFK